MTEQRRRVLIVSFDGLRPDMVTPELMPNLTAFAKSGVWFTHSRATFPTWEFQTTTASWIRDIGNVGIYT